MIVDTAQVHPESKNVVLECSGIPIDRLTRGTLFWDFDFTTDDGSPYHESVPIWLVGPIFKALRFPEVKPGSYDVEPTLSIGRKFKCDIVHEKVKDKVYARIKNAVPIEPSKEQKAAEESGIPF